MKHPKMTLDSIAEEVYDEIMKTWTGDDLRRFFTCNPRDLIQYHHTLGRYIRNKYHMWELSTEGHPDDTSMEVIELVWRTVTWPPTKKA